MSDDYEVTEETPISGGGKTTEETKDAANAEGQVSQEREETLVKVTSKNSEHEDIVQQLQKRKKYYLKEL